MAKYKISLQIERNREPGQKPEYDVTEAKRNMF